MNSLSNSSTHWDDHLYITENQAIRDINWHNIKEIFSTIYVGNYAPIHILSYAIDYSIWGADLFGFHLTNLILHIINSIILFFIIQKFCRNNNIPLFTALLFAVHPVQVESVAWLSQRKNVLSMLFFLFSFLFYIKYLSISGHRRSNYIFSLLLFTLAILTKAITVTLPMLLILTEYTFCIDAYITTVQESELISYNSYNLYKIYYKIPFFAIGILFSMLTFYTQSAHDAIGRNYEGGIYAGMLTTSKIIIYYINLLFFPINMSADYTPLISQSLLEHRTLFAAIAIIAGAIYIFKVGKASKLLFFCTAWFIIALLPVANLIPLATLMADRYMYFPSIGFCLIIGVFFDRQWSKRLYRPAILIIGIAIISCYSILTIHRNPVWRNDFTLWTDTLKKSPESIPALNNLAFYYAVNNSNLDEALKLSSRSLALDPDNLECLDTIAEIYYRKNEYDRAIAALKKAVSIAPENKSLRKKLEKIAGHK